MKLIPEAAPVTNATPGKSLLEAIVGNMKEKEIVNYVSGSQSIGYADYI